MKHSVEEILHVPGQICCLFHAIFEGCTRTTFLTDRGPVESGDLVGYMVDCLRGVDDAIMLFRSRVHW